MPPETTAAARAHDLLAFPGETGNENAATTITVLVAFAANLLIAAAKSLAAVLTRSASMFAEATHSWADTGNQVLLLIAHRRSQRPADQEHPLGYGREAYIWSLFAAIGVFVIGATVSVTRGISELVSSAEPGDYTVGYIVLAASFVLEGVSFLRTVSQVRGEARAMQRDLIEHVMATSDPTLRAVFAEDAAALIGLGLAAAGLAARELTGSVIPDAIGSIAVGVLLGVVALVLIQRNRQFLVGQSVSPLTRRAVLQWLRADPEVARVTYLRVDFVGPREVLIVGDVDLVGDDTETHVAVRVRELENRIRATPAVAGVLLGLSAPDEPTLAE
jgi:cation diffusion facilitator family transporter